MDITPQLLSFTYGITKDIGSSLGKHFSANDATSAERLRVHISEIVEWSRNIQFMGMSKSLETTEVTVPTSFSNQPRRFSGTSHGEILTEQEVLARRANTIILGDPGSGKTTAIKRLIQRITFEEPSAEDGHIDFPLLIICREMQSSNLLEELGWIFGVTLKDEESGGNQSESAKFERYQELRVFAENILSKNRVLLLVDGLDELDWDKRTQIEADLSFLSRIARSSHVIATCRSGSYTKVLEGFNVFEVLPLSEEEIEQVIAAWVHDNESFKKQVAQKPYRDLMNRPLLLCQIIMVYNYWGELPDRPIEIYRRIVSLLLEKWDRERNVDRATRYAEFSVEEKIKFLSALSYFLLARRNLKSFSHKDLMEAFEQTGRRFNFLTSEGPEIISEIESHTGIIVGSDSSYEFSHLSLQEFFCASFLAAQPDSTTASDLITRYPEAVAISICLSSDEARSLAIVIWPYLEPEAFHKHADRLKSFFSRLKLERPIFGESPDLARAVLRMAGLLSRLDGGAGDARFEFLSEIIKQEAVEKSLDWVLDGFEKVATADGVTLRSRKNTLTESSLMVDEISFDNNSSWFRLAVGRFLGMA